MYVYVLMNFTYAFYYYLILLLHMYFLMYSNLSVYPKVNGDFHFCERS